MSLMNVLKLQLDEDCRNDVVNMLKKQGVQVDAIGNFSPFNTETISACFQTFSEASKRIRDVFTLISKRKKVVFVVDTKEGAHAYLELTEVPRDEQLELIDKAIAVIVTDKVKDEKIPHA